jgi:hypothetical protein
MLNPYPSQKNNKMMRENNLFDKRMRMLDVLRLNGFLSGLLCEKLCILSLRLIFFYRGEHKENTQRAQRLRHGD